jgi:hypothetical protein
MTKPFAPHVFRARELLHLLERSNMGTTIQMLRSRAIEDVQADFNRAYPFLRIDFFKKSNGKALELKEKLNRTISLNIAGATQEGDLNIHDSMTVGELEDTFRRRFGTTVQVSRKSGNIWLETTMTDKWTLKQQNDHGRELSEPMVKTIPDEKI